MLNCSSVTFKSNAQLALDVIEMKLARGIPSWMFHTMDMAFMEMMTGHAPGDYRNDPTGVYLEFQKLAGTCMIDQFLAENPLTMTDTGYDSGVSRTATTGAQSIIRDGIVIDSPEAVAQHLESVEFPRLQEAIANWESTNADAAPRMVEAQVRTQELFGGEILKVPYADGFQSFPGFRYGQYGYENYFMAYALYPELMERDFALQGELGALCSLRGVKAYEAGGLPRVLRLDHDMTDSRGPLVNIQSLEEIWFPHFARAIKPYVDAGVRLLWHCDGNVSPMIPGLIESGIGGFQGFQYEDGVDYVSICRMKDRNGGPLMIWAGVSVTRTLPFGTRDDVVHEMKWLVENGPKTGLFLGGSSSIAPATNRENLKTMIEGLRYYREHGREW